LNIAVLASVLRGRSSRAAYAAAINEDDYNNITFVASSKLLTNQILYIDIQCKLLSWLLTIRALPYFKPSYEIM